ncbi:hypothetical protein GGR58DRAFT_426038 [Xylaria digitata]|nr:hypothetical protein GGR58DRAFT_426038 [Xylaria digitata]
MLVSRCIIFKSLRSNQTMSTTASAALRARGDEVRWQSKIYQAVMTPINFVAFLVSLYLIDSRYRAQRNRQHEGKASDNKRIPWLHRLLYRQNSSPYDWVGSPQRRLSPQSAHTTPRHEVDIKNEDKAPRSIKEIGSPWFSHTMQKKLLIMEAADAFGLQNSVLFALFVLAIFIAWVLWQAMMWLSTWSQNWIV